MSNGQLDQLLRRREQLNNRIRRKRAKVQEEERKRDTRRKILLGALVMSQWDGDAPPETWLHALDTFLTRPRDRHLFDLPQRPSGDDAAPERG